MLLCSAIYRGCFDAFKAVKQLTDNYVGCRNQTWNNRVRRWCLCDTDLCNTHAIGDDKYALQQQYTRTTGGSSASSSSSRSGVGGVASSSPITTHHTHHVVVQQHSYPAPSLPTPYVDFHSPKQAPPRLPEEGNATVARPTERYQPNTVNPAEYRTVWNNWHVDLSGVDQSPTTTETASGQIDADGGWIDAPRGVLHSVHQDQQPTRNYGDRQYRLVRPGYREPPQIAKSADADPDRHEIVEPISSARTSVTENETDPAARTRRSGSLNRLHRREKRSPAGGRSSNG
jgi:hypothetical protein